MDGYDSILSGALFHEYGDPNDPDYMKRKPVIFLFIAIYVFVFIAGNVSNVAMLIVCLRQWCDAVRTVPSSSSNYLHQMSSAVTNALVLNLAIADIILCVFSLTSTPFSYFAIKWPFGDFLCRFTPSTLILAVCVISFTSTIMAVDRHIAICYPHSHLRLTVRSSMIAIALLWLASTGACLPLYFSYAAVEEQYEFPGPNNSTEIFILYKCTEQWHKDSYRRFFSISILVMQFVLPAVVIAYCYIGIFIALKNQKRFRQRPKPTPSNVSALSARPSDCATVATELKPQKGLGVVATNSAAHNMVSNAQRRLFKTTAILCAMVLIFMACWMPINVLLLVADYYETENFWETTSWFPVTYFASHVLAMTSTLWNPLLYGWLNERLRPEMLKICFAFGRRRRFPKNARNMPPAPPTTPTVRTNVHCEELTSLTANHLDHRTNGDSAPLILTAAKNGTAVDLPTTCETSVVVDLSENAPTPTTTIDSNNSNNKNSNNVVDVPKQENYSNNNNNDNNNNNNNNNNGNVATHHEFYLLRNIDSEYTL